MLPTVTSCGVLIFRRKDARVEFLLMRHRNRLDLPKGHINPGESELSCALRELTEETAIPATAVWIDPDFNFTTTYTAIYKRFGNRPVEKRLVVYLGLLRESVKIRPTEHLGFEWTPWAPPHRVQPETIDPLLAAVEKYWRTHSLPE